MTLGFWDFFHITHCNSLQCYSLMMFYEIYNVYNNVNVYCNVFFSSSETLLNYKSFDVFIRFLHCL